MKYFCILLIILNFSSAFAGDEAATLQWSSRVELSAPVSGVIKAVHVEIGEQVKKGQVLLALDSAMFQSRVSEIQATITRLQAEAEEAKKDLERVQELYARTVVATAELDQAKLRLVKADSMVAEARASLKQQQKALEDSMVRAPFDGVVVARQAEPGMSVAATLQPQTLLVLAKSGEMIARMYLNAAQIEKLKVGQAVSVTRNGQSYSGKIKLLGLEPVRGEAGYLADVLFSSKEQLRAGVPATVKLP